MKKTDKSRVLCLYLRKGGVGKTSSALNFATILSEAGYKVLCIDADPQGNLSKLLNQGRILRPREGEEYVKGVFEIVTEDIDAEKVIRSTHFPELAANQIDFVPAGDRFNGADRSGLLADIAYGDAAYAKGICKTLWEIDRKNHPEMSDDEYAVSLMENSELMNSIAKRYRMSVANDQMDRIEPFTIFRDWINRIRDRYDYIIIDVAPTKNTLSENCMIASNFIIAPTNLDGFSEDAVSDLLQNVSFIRENENRKLRFLGMLLTAVRCTTSISKQMCDRLWMQLSPDKQVDEERYAALTNLRRDGKEWKPSEEDEQRNIEKHKIVSRVIRFDNAVTDANTKGFPLSFFKKGRSKAITDYIYAANSIGFISDDDMQLLLNKHGQPKDNYSFEIDPDIRKIEADIKKEESAARKKGGRK